MTTARYIHAHQSRQGTPPRADSDVLRRLYVIAQLCMWAKDGSNDALELLRIADKGGLVMKNEKRWLREVGLLS